MWREKVENNILDLEVKEKYVDFDVGEPSSEKIVNNSVVLIVLLFIYFYISVQSLIYFI